MTKRLFEFIKEDCLNNEAIVMVLVESILQSFAEANFGRELSDIELNRFANEVWDNENTNGIMCDLMSCIIEEITNEKDDDWNLTDQLFLNKLELEEKKRCLKEHSEQLIKK